MNKTNLLIACFAFIGLSAMASQTGLKQLQEQAPSSSNLKLSQLTPTAITAVEISPSKQLIKWENASTANSYIIKYAEQGPDARTEQKLLNVENATAFTLSELNTETTYDVWVKAVTRDGESAWSEKISFTTASSCAQPMFVEAMEVTNKKAVISWQANGSNGDFLVRYTDGGEYPILMHEKVKAQTGFNYYELKNLDINTTYHFWVKSICETSKSDWSSKVEFTTPSTATTPHYSQINDLSSKVTVLPNLASEKIEITFSENIPTFIHISDVTGRTVYQNENGMYSGGNTLVINTNDFIRGLYIVTIRSKDSVHIQKFMVQ